MFSLLIFIAFGLAILNWVAVYKGWKILIYITKPGTMLALIAWMIFSVGVSGPLILFTLGLFFSMIGDICLMLPREQFIAGLVAFLLGHVCYIIGFNFEAPPITVVTIGMLVGVALIAFFVIRPLRAGLLAKGQKALLQPVQIYAVVISLMLLSALVTLVRPEWEKTAAAFACLGAALFYLSDTMIAWNRFVRPLSNERLKVMVTYHLGQILIALGAATQFMK
jgi:alkenylglycerophosphocholine hydrolase